MIYIEKVVEIIYPVGRTPNNFPSGAVNSDQEYSYGLTKTIATIMLNTINQSVILLPITFSLSVFSDIFNTLLVGVKMADLRTNPS